MKHVFMKKFCLVHTLKYSNEIYHFYLNTKPITCVCMILVDQE